MAGFLEWVVKTRELIFEDLRDDDDDENDRLVAPRVAPDVAKQRMFHYPPLCPEPSRRIGRRLSRPQVQTIGVATGPTRRMAGKTTLNPCLGRLEFDP
ncbi:MAG: hypothetical protein HC927_04925 [Deltaproteobacteria bacterium]|nr:hypothetical protein [Deltaproteobacteria bacterium]